MKPVFLWTDICLWLVLLAVIAYGIRVRGNEMLRNTWSHVFQSGPALASAVVLLFAMGIALMDSLHFQSRIDKPGSKELVYSPQVKSALDVVLGKMGDAREKSYSAPLSIYALNKESVERDGKTIRDYPRLKVAGQHLKNPDDKWRDISWRAFRGALIGGIVGLCIYLLWLGALVGGQAGAQSAVQSAARSGPASGAWRTVRTWGLATLITGGVLCGALYQVSGFYHVLGTDKVGVDVLYSAIKSLRTAVVLGLLTTLVTLPLGVLAGLAAGYFKGWVDDVVQYVYTTLNSIPGVLLIAAAVLMLQVALDSNPQAFQTAAEKADLRLFFLCVILGVTSWTGLARLLRGETLKLRELDYVQAARAFGASHWQVITRHLLPNVMHIVLIMLVMDFSGLVLAEAVLSYVGVGVDPSTQSYGTMINAARLELSREPVVWWTLAAAFTFMLVLVLAANLFSDAVRDAFDPRARQLKKSLIRV
jgi:peptide/nickel transport system permease protein